MLAPSVDDINALKKQQSALHERVVRLETTTARNHAEVMAAIAAQGLGGSTQQGAHRPGASASQGSGQKRAAVASSGSQPMPAPAATPMSSGRRPDSSLFGSGEGAANTKLYSPMTLERRWVPHSYVFLGKVEALTTVDGSHRGARRPGAGGGDGVDRVG